VASSRAVLLMVLCVPVAAVAPHPAALAAIVLTGALGGAALPPLVVLIMSADQPLDAGILVDRLVATLAGAGIALAANAAAVRWLRVA